MNKFSNFESDELCMLFNVMTDAKSTAISEYGYFIDQQEIVSDLLIEMAIELENRGFVIC